LKTKLQIDIDKQFPALWGKLNTWMGQAELTNFIIALIRQSANNKSRANAAADILQGKPDPEAGTALGMPAAAAPAAAAAAAPAPAPTPT